MLTFITDRIRVFLFCLFAAFLALINPSKTLQIVNAVLNRQDWIDTEIDRLHK